MARQDQEPIIGPLVEVVDQLPTALFRVEAHQLEADDGRPDRGSTVSGLWFAAAAGLEAGAGVLLGPVPQCAVAVRAAEPREGAGPGG
ncbi:hypothetical protein ACFZBU_45770 [Embleya sp. NPDC008237]|uniref:hypothetical protein n=1 Tax=Embleya sp. NPDC008237 TaxID=3363978 RepID=UPI0036E9A290